MKLLTERYQEQIAGVISCYDRIILQGTIPSWCYDGGMTSYLYANNIRIFDYPQLAQDLRTKLEENIRQIAKENNVTIEYIKKIKAFRKEDKIKEIIKNRGNHPGIVHIFSAMESCTSYKPWHDKTTGKTFLKRDSGRCLHYYIYFSDKELGLCYLRIPTWCPFRLQFYCNGHNWLAYKLTKRNIPFTLIDNAFVHIGDYEKAQKLSDNIRVADLHHALDLHVERLCPFIKSHGLTYHWSISQAEYATDIIFKKQSDLKPIYDSLTRTAIHSVKPENIATFLGQKLHGLYQGEMGNRFNTRIEGTRIKHQMGAVSIKMYDKMGLVLRIETTTNDVSQFKQYRMVEQRDGKSVEKMAPMKKSIYSLFDLASILRASNRRYLEFISCFDDPSQGAKKLLKVTQPVTVEERSIKGINFFDMNDLQLLQVLVRGEFNIHGFRNKSIRQHIQKSTGAVSALLKRLLLHGLIKKVRGTYKYYLTSLGKAVLTTGLRIREMLVIPQLASVSA
jgi:DNA-binding MarR family transcriptional regulator